MSAMLLFCCFNCTAILSYSGCRGDKTSLGWLHTFCRYRRACNQTAGMNRRPVPAMSHICTELLKDTSDHVQTDGMNRRPVPAMSHICTELLEDTSDHVQTAGMNRRPVLATSHICTELLKDTSDHVQTDGTNRRPVPATAHICTELLKDTSDHVQTDGHPNCKQELSFHLTENTASVCYK